MWPQVYLTSKLSPLNPGEQECIPLATYQGDGRGWIRKGEEGSRLKMKGCRKRGKGDLLTYPQSIFFFLKRGWGGFLCVGSGDHRRYINCKPNQNPYTFFFPWLWDRKGAWKDQLFFFSSRDLRQMNSFFLSLFSSFFMLLHQQLLQETLRKDKKKEKNKKNPSLLKWPPLTTVVVRVHTLQVGYRDRSLTSAESTGTAQTGSWNQKARGSGTRDTASVARLPLLASLLLHTLLALSSNAEDPSPSPSPPPSAFFYLFYLLLYCTTGLCCNCI